MMMELKEIKSREHLFWPEKERESRRSQPVVFRGWAESGIGGNRRAAGGSRAASIAAGNFTD